MKILALIPARSGSKRLPGKNIRPLGGKPLIVWTIEAAIQSACFVDVVVSTDDPVIADVAAIHGATVPGLRPAVLSTDEAGSAEVAIYVLDQWEGVSGGLDGLMLLQPTSPFRTVETIRRAVDEFERTKGMALVGVSAAESHPAWCLRVDERGALEPFFPGNLVGKRSQDLTEAYVLNGSLYIISPIALRKTRSFVFSGVRPFTIQSSSEALDIDTDWDWMVAEAVLNRR